MLLPAIDEEGGVADAHEGAVGELLQSALCVNARVCDHVRMMVLNKGVADAHEGAVGELLQSALWVNARTHMLFLWCKIGGQ